MNSFSCDPLKACTASPSSFIQWPQTWQTTLKHADMRFLISHQKKPISALSKPKKQFNITEVTAEQLWTCAAAAAACQLIFHLLNTFSLLRPRQKTLERALTISTLCSRRGSRERPAAHTGWTSLLYTCNEDAASGWLSWRTGLCRRGPSWHNSSFCS